MRQIPYDKLYCGETNISLSYDGSRIINKAYVGSALSLVRFSEYPRLKISEEELVFNSYSGESSVVITTNASWSASTSSSWITLTVSGSNLIVAVPDYVGEEDREGTVVVTAYNADASISSSITVSQELVHYATYIKTDGTCYFDTGIIPDIYTKIEVDLIPDPWGGGNWLGFIGAQDTDDGPTTFQIRRNASSARWSARVGNGTANVGPNYTAGQRYLLTLDRYNFNVDGTDYATGTGSMNECHYTMFISAIHNPAWETQSEWLGPYRAVNATFYRIKVWKNDVLVGDFRPAIFNEEGCFYDEVTGTYKMNLGTGTPIVGTEA